MRFEYETMRIGLYFLVNEKWNVWKWIDLIDFYFLFFLKVYDFSHQVEEDGAFNGWFLGGVVHTALVWFRSILIMNATKMQENSQIF